MSQPTKKPPPLEITFRGVTLTFAESALSILDYSGAATFETTIESATQIRDTFAAWIAWKKSDQPPPTTTG
jgi:hypothetical protein